MDERVKSEDETQEAGGRSASSPSRIGHEACLEAQESLEEGLLLARADLANERRRRGLEVERAVKKQRTRILKDVLQVVDNLERALGQGDASAEALLTGVAAVLSQAEQLLSEHGVTRLEAEGQLFDPSMHEAVGLAEEGEPGRVAIEVVRGYRLDDDILRAAKVLVGRTEGE